MALSNEISPSLGGIAVLVSTVGGVLGQSIPAPWGPVVTAALSLVGAILVIIARSQSVSKATATTATSTALQMIPPATDAQASAIVKDLVAGKTS